MQVRENVRLSELTTMRLGGPAELVVEIENVDEVSEAFAFVKEKGLPFYFLGGGANSLGRDEGFAGAIIMNRIKGLEVVTKSGGELVVRAFGGEVWDDFVRLVVEQGFSGVEAMSKIPGTVAAAPVQNIGAYGQEAKDTLVKVEAYDSLLDEFVELTNEECGFGYRRSIFNTGEKKGRYFIISATFRFTKRQLEPPFYNSLQAYLDEHGIKDYAPKNIREAVMAIRATKLPDPAEVASAGSFFKNILLDKAEAEEAERKGVPMRETSDGKYKVNTGWLLENAGLKGKVFHGFRVSEKAALILINESAKTYADLERAVAEIQAAVKEKYGLTIEPEPVVIEKGE